MDRVSIFAVCPVKIFSHPVWSTCKSGFSYCVHCTHGPKNLGEAEATPLRNTIPPHFLSHKFDLSGSSHIGVDRGSSKVRGCWGPAHFGQRRGWPARETLLPNVCYPTKFGCCWSNRLGIGMGSCPGCALCPLKASVLGGKMPAPNGNEWTLPEMCLGCGWPPRNTLLPICVKLGRSRSNHLGVGRIPQKVRTLGPDPWNGVWWPVRTCISPTCHVMPVLVILSEWNYTT